MHYGDIGRETVCVCVWVWEEIESEPLCEQEREEACQYGQKCRHDKPSVTLQFSKVWTTLQTGFTDRVMTDSYEGGGTVEHTSEGLY